MTNLGLCLIAKLSAVTTVEPTPDHSDIQSMTSPAHKPVTSDVIV